RSTTSALISVMHHILSHLDQSAAVCGQFLDIRKAFDSVSHSLLLEKPSKRKARKVVGLIYRHFYSNSSPSTLLHLYTTLVRPILEYASVVWDPVSTSVSSSIEGIQHFALKMVSKSWSTSYFDLLSAFNLSSLAHRH
uniref:Reverse transcriptase domain-containing protein n=1 Tax=Amphimedon queenslandica TaxID=400682 RepID=A0A1X7UDT2_AMPQE